MPVVVSNLAVPELSVTLPVRVTVPEPVVCTKISPDAPVDTFALIATLLFVESSWTLAVPLSVMADSTVSKPPDKAKTPPVVPEIVPRFMAPVDWIVNALAPIVIVCPEEVNVPPLYNPRT